jgi:hypothetical protein
MDSLLTYGVLPFVRPFIQRVKADLTEQQCRILLYAVAVGTRKKERRGFLTRRTNVSFSSCLYGKSNVKPLQNNFIITLASFICLTTWIKILDCLQPFFLHSLSASSFTLPILSFSRAAVV